MQLEQLISECFLGIPKYRYLVTEDTEHKQRFILLKDSSLKDDGPTLDRDVELQDCKTVRAKVLQNGDLVIPRKFISFYPFLAIDLPSQPTVNLNSR